MTMRTMHLAVTVRGPVRTVVIVLDARRRGLVEWTGVGGVGIGVARTLDPAAGKSHINLQRPDAGSAHPANVDFDLWNPQASG